MWKTIAIVLLLLIGSHLLLYGFLRRRISAAQRAKEIEDER